METMHFHIAQTKIFFEDTFASHQGGPNEQFGTHKNLSWGVHGNLNWMPGYILFGWLVKITVHWTEVISGHFSISFFLLSIYDNEMIFAQLCAF